MMRSSRITIRAPSRSRPPLTVPPFAPPARSATLRSDPPWADHDLANAGYHVSVLTTTDLDVLISDTEAEMARVIAAAEDERTTQLYDWVRFHLGLDAGATRGKRLRPLLGLLAYQSIAGEHQRALPGAAAVEMGHNFSLVHDDIQDESPERRHRPALWTFIGTPQALN